MKNKSYKDKYGNRITIRRNKNGSFYIKTVYDRDSYSTITITKEQFEAMKELNALSNN